MGQARSKVPPLKFRKADFQLSRELISGVPGETAPRDKAVEQSWQIFEEVFHRMQELEITRRNKSGKEGRRLAWLSREMLVKLKGKKQQAVKARTGNLGRVEMKFSCVGMASVRPR